MMKAGEGGSPILHIQAQFSESQLKKACQYLIGLFNILFEIDRNLLLFITGQLRNAILISR